LLDPDSPTTAIVDEHVHDHLNIDVDVPVIVDLVGFSSPGEASFAQLRR
jgi:hypothetical protein